MEACSKTGIPAGFELGVLRRSTAAKPQPKALFHRHPWRQGATRLGVVFAEGGNDKLKIRRDADFEPKTGLSAPTPRRRVTAAAGFPLLSRARGNRNNFLLHITRFFMAVVCAAVFASCASGASVKAGIVRHTASAAYLHEFFPQWQPLYDGIEVLAGRTKYPPLKFWAIRADLQDPTLEIVMTPPPAPAKRAAPPLPYGSIYSTKVSSFARANRCLAALNAGPCWPVNAHEWEERILTGIFIADGKKAADSKPGFGALVFYKDGRAAIVSQAAMTGGTEAVQNAAGGFFILLDSGEVGRHVFNRKARHPRSAAGLSAGGRFLYLLAIDGRWFDTIGATEAETGLLLAKLGAHNGLNLDGGGSTALALQGGGGIFIVNRPIHKQIPGKERAVGTCIGIRLKNPPSPMASY